MENEVPSGLSVSRIEVGSLFGQFSYDLQSDGADISKLLIFYGDNGSGKTTILNCIFHLLSPASNRGHRGALARVPFARFCVILEDGTEVCAERSSDRLTGSFAMSLKRAGGPKISRRFEFDSEFSLKDLKLDEEELAVLPALKALGLRVHLLSDERKILTDMAPVIRSAYQQAQYRVHAGATASRAPNYLEEAMRRAVDSVRKQAIDGSGTGEVNSNTLYADISKRIVSPYTASFPQVPSVRQLIDDLKQQAERSISFARFGLATELRIDEFLGPLQSPGAQEHAGVLYQVLRPFIDGFKVRLDALQLLHDKISTFVETLNAFYRGKSVAFDLRRGVLVTSHANQTLNPNVLSSGEKQLLLLFCNVLATGDDASIFIIDEPELSLNIKWQRKLVDALLECTRNTSTQFLLATHSIELLTQHQHNVLQLAPRVPA